MAVVDFEYALGLQSEQDRRQAVELQLKEDMLGTGSLRAVPRGWTLESDFELVRYTCHHKIRHPTVQDFEASWLEEFPMIAHHHPEHLASRLLALHRVVRLLDEVVEAIIPVHLAAEPHDLCDSSFVNDPFAEFDALRQLYPLSTLREGVVAQLLDLTTKKSKHLPPIIQIDRRRARALRQPSELSSGTMTSIFIYFDHVSPGFQLYPHPTTHTHHHHAPCDTLYIRPMLTITVGSCNPIL